MLQDPLVSGDALGRALAAASFLCALSSLCNGVMLYIHLTKIKKADHALVWVTVSSLLSGSTPMQLTRDCPEFPNAHLWKVDEAFDHSHRSRDMATLVSVLLHLAFDFCRPLSMFTRAVVFFVMALSISYVWQPPNIASQLLPRIAVACALVFCVVQTLMVVWTLRKLKPGLSPQSGVQARGTDTLDV